MKRTHSSYEFSKKSTEDRDGFLNDLLSLVWCKQDIIPLNSFLQ